MNTLHLGPIADSYWVVNDLFLAGEYPGTHGNKGTLAKIAKITAAGIRTFIDLTEADEPLEKYNAVLQTVAERDGFEAKHIRHPIPDLGLPAREQMKHILTTIREETEAGRPVYVHCWGGVGRTGTVVGCWLAEQGLTGTEALERIAEIRQHTPDGHRRSPETEAQRRFVCEWLDQR